LQGLISADCQPMASMFLVSLVQSAGIPYQII